MCQIVGGDDRVVKAGAKLIDWTRPYHPNLDAMQLLWREVLPGKPAWKKTVRLAHVVATQHQNNEELINLRCDRGAQIVRKIGLAENVANAVCHLDEHWDGSGYPNRFKKSNIPLLSRLMGVAQHLDAFCMEKGTQVAIDTMLDRSGRWFDPTITRVAHALHQSGDLWNLCTPGADVTSAHQAVLDQEPDSPLASRPCQSIKSVRPSRMSLMQNLHSPFATHIM